MVTRHRHAPGQFPATPLGALSHWCHSLHLWKGAVFTQTGNGSCKGGLGTIPLCRLSRLAPGQAQAETSRGEHWERQAVAPCQRAGRIAMG